MNFLLDFLVEIYLTILKWLKVPLSLSDLLCTLLFQFLTVCSKAVHRLRLGQFETVWQVCTPWHVVHNIAQEWNGGLGSDILREKHGEM